MRDIRHSYRHSQQLVQLLFHLILDAVDLTALNILRSRQCIHTLDGLVLSMQSVSAFLSSLLRSYGSGRSLLLFQFGQPLDNSLLYRIESGLGWQRVYDLCTHHEA